MPRVAKANACVGSFGRGRGKGGRQLARAVKSEVESNDGKDGSDCQNSDAEAAEDEESDDDEDED